MFLTNIMANHMLDTAPNLGVLPPTKEAFDEHESSSANQRCTLDTHPFDLRREHYMDY
jgi:hypothetical protein